MINQQRKLYDLETPKMALSYPSTRKTLSQINFFQTCGLRGMVIPEEVTHDQIIYSQTGNVMPSENFACRLAIVGFGPRGLGALEALANGASNFSGSIEVDIFDPNKFLGSGPNYDPDQSDFCILNIPVRALKFDPGSVLSGHIQPYASWSSKDDNLNSFPPRSFIGKYLTKRFNALCKATDTKISISHKRAIVTGFERDDAGWWLSNVTGKHGPYDEILLTQGQPATDPDPQMVRWIDHAKQNDLELLPAYPANTLIDAANDWSDRTIAVRGLGLTTFDVVRMLTGGLGGKFLNGEYIKSGHEPRKILPFSLNGLPPAPKPATLDIEDGFNLTAEETRAFETALSASIFKTSQDALKTLTDALIEPTVRILGELGSLIEKDDVKCWLAIELDAPGSQETDGAIETLKLYIAIAHGQTPPCIGYVVGQVWHNWQNELRESFNTKHKDPETKAAIIGFDESLKRFSAGPPVEAAEELLILIETGLVSLCMVEDPAVILDTKGWRLVDGNDALFASVMIDAVLPSPNLEIISDQFIKSCVDRQLAVQIFDDLGARTTPDGQLVNSNGSTGLGICALGRLAFGSVISVDSLNDCFGPSTTRWAKGVLERVAKPDAH